MELRDTIKALRRELGITQLELAKALHINVTTVSRWELGKSCPNPSVASLLYGYAYTHSASRESINLIKEAINDASKQKITWSVTGLSAVEHSSLVQLIDDSSFAICVSDMKTDKMLYANKRALEILCMSASELCEYKCYECLMKRDTPCENCRKSKLSGDRFIVYEAKRPKDDTTYRISTKLIRWNGREAQVRYLMKLE